MSSRGKKKTTMAKLSREARLRERRVEKQMRKEARRDSGANDLHRAPGPAEESDAVTTGELGPQPVGSDSSPAPAEE